jgi:hypothetical protein
VVAEIPERAGSYEVATATAVDIALVDVGLPHLAALLMVIAIALGCSAVRIHQPLRQDLP